MMTITDIDSQEKISQTPIVCSKDIVCPSQLIANLKCSSNIEQFISQKRQEISKIIHGDDDRLLIIVGPCSIHDVDEAIEYAKKLSILARQYESTLLIVMRVYLEKPRTTVGWKGLMYDPHLDGSNDIEYGLKVSRQLLIDINNLQLACACEFLQPLFTHYISDLVSWAAIGARTTESQIHRELVSGLNMPIGFKNGTAGCVQMAIDACIASRQAHISLSISHYGKIICHNTGGNNDVHVILRGGTVTGPNYSREHVFETRKLLKKGNLTTKIMIDCSHGNSMKSHERQNLVIIDVCNQLAANDQAIMGVMIESNHIDGNQTFVEGYKHLLEYGKSITDPCIGWNMTVTQLDRLSESVLKRRQYNEMFD